MAANPYYETLVEAINAVLAPLVVIDLTEAAADRYVALVAATELVAA